MVTSGLVDQCWVHKQKVVSSSPITVNVLCPWVRHFTTKCTSLDPGVTMGTDIAGKVTDLLWRRCMKPNGKLSLAHSFQEGDGRTVFTGWKLTLSCSSGTVHLPLKKNGFRQTLLWTSWCQKQVSVSMTILIYLWMT